MINAVVLVNADLNSQENVLQSLKTVDGIEEAHALFGIYDFLVKIKAHSIEELKNITRLKIKQIIGVTNSLTLLINE